MNLNQYLAGFLTEPRKEKIARVLAQRTRSLVAVVEDIYDPHNANAVIRSCDAFGIQELHVIENRNKFRVSARVASGSDRWVELHRYSTAEECITKLKQRGYQIVATTPHGNTVSLSDFVPKQPTAILFGSEHLGLSETALASADLRLKIPMVGFCESLNLSVSAATTLYTLNEKMIQQKLRKPLSEPDAQEVELKWLRASLKRAAQLERGFHPQNHG
ncbi:MAG: RNA methyltransferase [Leptospiraceae bacterium]|nr:RNA methyltransferase [Leptospiraceae bacterium]